MKIEELMSGEVSYCRPTDSLRSASRRLCERDIGGLPVLGASGQVVGMLTDHDVCLAAYAYDRPLSALRVSGAMSRGVVYSCRPEDGLEEAEWTMSQHRLHRLPVVDRHGHLVGTLALDDVRRQGAGGPRAPVEDVAAPMEDAAAGSRRWRRSGRAAGARTGGSS